MKLVRRREWVEVRAHRGGGNGGRWRCEGARWEKGSRLNRWASAFGVVGASPRSKGELRGRTSATGLHRRRRRQWRRGGPTTTRTCAGAWRNTSPSSLGPRARDDDADLKRAADRRDKEGPGRRCTTARPQASTPISNLNCLCLNALILSFSIGTSKSVDRTSVDDSLLYTIDTDRAQFGFEIR
jgi:hypothetical protein